MDMTAYFLGKVASDASGGGGSVQPDYLQNNPSAKDYIKNRPFYTEITKEVDTNIIIPLQEVEGITADGMPEGYVGFVLEGLDSDSIKKMASIVDKGQYNLTIDETTKQITATTVPDAEGFFFGNLSLAGVGDDTGETYGGSIYVTYDHHGEYSGDVVLVLQTTETTHTIGLSHIGDVVPIIVEDTYSFEPMDNGVGRYFTNIWEASFEGDNVYNLTFDGETYEGLSWVYHEDSGLDCLGNLSITGMGDDTGEKYLLAKIPRDDASVMLLMATSYEAGDYMVSLEKSLVKTSEIIHKIDSKYLDVSHIEKDMDKLQNNLNKLNNFVGTSYSEQLYERYGLDRSEYPYITITSNNVSSSGFRIELYFSERPPTPSVLGNSQFVFPDDNKCKGIIPIKYFTEGAELKSIVNHLIQVSDSDINIEDKTPIYISSSSDYFYYNYEDPVIDGLVNSSKFDLDVSTLQSEVYNIKNTLIKDGLDEIILKSSSESSTKRFRITVNDEGVISAIEM